MIKEEKKRILKNMQSNHQNIYLPAELFPALNGKFE